MLVKLFYLSGLPVFIWYIGLRASLLGNEQGKTIGNTYTLNWWFANFNYLTAWLSIAFLVITLMDFSYSFKIRPIYWIAGFLCARNVWYTIIDTVDYYNYPSEKQLIFIILDIIMAINTGIYIHIFRSMN